VSIEELVRTSVQSGIEDATIWGDTTPWSLLVGAAFAMTGGFIAQFVVWAISLKHTKEALRIALRAELKSIRENLGTELQGYRDSLRMSDPPTPTVFARHMPIFLANASNLGQLRDNDLVEQIVEVYSGLQDLTDRANQYKNVSNASIGHSQLNEIQFSATAAHVSVMKLHNTMCNVPQKGKLSRDNTEVESRRLLAEIRDLHLQGKMSDAWEKVWTDSSNTEND